MGKWIKGSPHQTDGTTTARKATCGPFYKTFGENERKEEKGKGNKRIGKNGMRRKGIKKSDGERRKGRG